jgi:hypothetical protein
VHDNNNSNTPASGIAATAIVGSGINLSGGINNTVQYNDVTNNGSWGILLSDYPRTTQVQMLPNPREPGMTNPCDGVPANSWCK